MNKKALGLALLAAIAAPFVVGTASMAPNAQAWSALTAEHRARILAKLDSSRNCRYFETQVEARDVLGIKAVLASAAACKAHGLKPLARIVSYANHAQAPVEFPTAPVKAIANALERAQLKAADIELFEINEAFAVVALACTKLAGLDATRVNVRGGAVALGHPIGASGARIVTTLLHAMRERSARRGLASLCIGGGEANAVIIERIES